MDGLHQVSTSVRPTGRVETDFLRGWHRAAAGHHSRTRAGLVLKKRKVPALGAAAQKRGVCARVYHDPEEAQLGAAQGVPCAPGNGFEVTSYIGGEGHNLQEHSVVLDPRRSRQGPARRALPHRSAASLDCAGVDDRQPEPFQVRRQAARTTAEYRPMPSAD
jgi:small subunit ribosomal protein S12